ncbi:glycosyltransferase family 4 protein [uncultured Helicobacter sp.]|uniref:glycosyltransferase family 4 protein n=1 Tax=uncultured Helicobacter sp. TaxID=175537 RepID=UPI00374E2743
MKILLTIGDITITGGAERVVVNLANAFVQSGHSVQILSFFKANYSLLYALDERVNLVYMREQSEGEFKNQGGLCKRFYAKNLFKFFVSFRVWREYRVDCVIGNDWIFTPFFKHKHTHYVKLLHLNFSRYNRRNNYFDTLVLLSYAEISRYTPHHNHVCVIPNFLPTLPTQTTDYAQKVVVSVGRMDSGDQKGFLRLVDIWDFVMQDSRFVEWQLHIVGDGILRQELQKRIESKGLQDSIILKSFTTDIVQEYLNASIYAMTSHFEGLPMVLLESASYGLPAIAFDIATGPSDIILDSHTGYLVADGDLQAYAGKLENLMRDETLRENLGRQAKERMRECFSKEAIAPLWEEILEQK